jgi:Na+-transporting methylmalonyl-CoA/oxaloacetate decarboxylase gamma subunit
MGNTNLSNALWITSIGIVLVFIGIFLLWGMMELLVRATQKREKPIAADNADSTKDELKLKQKAAAVAVVAAISFQNSTTISTSLPQQEGLSPWQSIHRGYRNLPFIKHSK